MPKKKNKMLYSTNSTNIITTILYAFKINKNPLPWTKAIIAGICSGLPPLIGLLFGNLQYGLLAGIGSLTYLYVFQVPYAQRAKKLFFALIGMTVSVGLGTLLAPLPIASAIVVGLIGAIATFIFGALRIPGPAAIFFILCFTLSTGMTIDPSLAPLRAGLVFSGGVLAWLMGMMGWLVNPYGPETLAVKKSYIALAHYMDSLGKEPSNEERQRLTMTFKSAHDTLLAGYLYQRSSEQYNRLFLLHDRANTIFMNILEYCEPGKKKLPSELREAILTISDSIGNKRRNQKLLLRKPKDQDEDINRIFSKIQAAAAILSEPINKAYAEIKISKPSLKTIFIRSLDKDSIVFLTAIRYGIILTIAALIAYWFDFNRSYWVTLSCAAVMSGATILSTFHRAIQRSIGTIVGILIATIILSFKPEGIVIVIAIVILTASTELAIVLNYGIAALFITPNALLMAESTSPLQDASIFTSVRVTDVLLGCLIGLIGTLLFGRRHASSILPLLLARTIRSAQQLLMLLFSDQRISADFVKSLERTDLQTNLTNLNLVYTTALGEISTNNERLESLRPAIFSINQLGYLLDSSKNDPSRPILSDESLAQFLLAFENMRFAADQKRPLSKKHVPDINGFSKIPKEINDLQDALEAIGSRLTL